jgi:transposase-like protein
MHYIAPEIKSRIVEDVIENKLTVQEGARKHKVSQTGLRRWLAIDGRFKFKPRRPRKTGSQLQQLVKAVVASPSAKLSQSEPRDGVPLAVRNNRLRKALAILFCEAIENGTLNLGE